MTSPLLTYDPADPQPGDWPDTPFDGQAFLDVALGEGYCDICGNRAPDGIHDDPETAAWCAETNRQPRPLHAL